MSSPGPGGGYGRRSMDAHYENRIAELERQLADLHDARLRQTDKLYDPLRKEFLSQSEVFHYENWLAGELELARGQIAAKDESLRVATDALEYYAEKQRWNYELGERMLIGPGVAMDALAALEAGKVGE